jgi:N-acetylglucosamine kinase-like BadF-type ATPase
MGKILAVDGGGSKLRMVLFDDDFKLLGQGLSGGVNVTQTTPENSRANVADCLGQVFKGERSVNLDRIYVVFVGPVNILYEELERYATVKEIVELGEAKAGMLAGIMEKEGILALSGTGCDVFYVREEESLNVLLGGWGPILGDQGSGTWIGEEAIKAAVKYVEGWGKPTKIYSLIERDWKLEYPRQMIQIVHGAVAPFRVVASLTHIVGEAARAGDEVALEILAEAGEQMAKQADCLIRREGIPERYWKVVCCGGAWKTHPRMFDTFRRRLEELYPNIQVYKPWFEHILAGLVNEILLNGIPIEQGKQLIREKFPDYVINW